MEKFRDENEYLQSIEEAFASDNKEVVRNAIKLMEEKIYNDIKKDMNSVKDIEDEKEKRQILLQRGYRVLTSEETKFYENLLAHSKGKKPNQSLANFLTEVDGDLMPSTIIEDVFRDLTTEHPLLSKINARFVSYLTKVLLNANPEQNAVWGPITAEIVKEITSAFKEIKITENKLSCFALISNDFLAKDIGPMFLDAYIRSVLKESMANGLESAIIDGTGINTPIGLRRDIHQGVSFNTTTGYPVKTKQVVKSFKPAEYGTLLSKLAVKEDKKTQKNFNKVTLICNLTDYLTKIMPSTTVQSGVGTYVKDQFPFATEVIISKFVPQGECIIALLEEYYLALGISRSDVIEESTDIKFFEDQTAYKMVQYAAGRAEDDSSAILCDISALEPLYITVEQRQATITA